MANNISLTSFFTNISCENTDLALNNFIKCCSSSHIITFDFLKKVVRDLDNYPNISIQIKRKIKDAFELIKFKDKIKKKFKIPKISILNHKISKSKLLEILTLFVEISTYAFEFQRKDITNLGIPIYSEITLKSINNIFNEKELSFLEETENPSNLELELLEHIWDLFFAFYNISLVDEMLDEIVYDEYILIKDGDLSFYTEFQGKEEINRHFLEFQKQKTKDFFLSNQNKNKVSEDIFFQKNDTTLKTDEGLGIFFTQNLEVIKKPNGTTSIPVDGLDENQIFDLIQKQHQAYYYRVQMQQHYELKDEDNIKNLFVYLGKNIENEDINVSVHSIISLCAWIKTVSTLLYNPTSFQRLNNKVYFSEIFNLNPYPENLEGIELQSFGKTLIYQIIQEYHNLLEKQCLNEVIVFGNIDIFLQNILNENEDLKKHTLQQLKAIFDYIVKIDLVGLGKINGEEFYIIPNAFTNIDHINKVYNTLVCENLYSNKKDIQNQETHREREKNMCETLASYFKDFKTTYNLGFNANGINSGNLSGEFDVLIVDEISKSILAIEVKLKNTYCFNRKGKYIWYDNKIKNEALTQIKKYYDYFYLSDCGKSQVKKLFGLDIEMKTKTNDGYRLYTLVVTDNFYFDHFEDIYDNDRKLSTVIVSFFELKTLLQGNELFEENTKNWLIYHYSLILNVKKLQNQEIEAFIESENKDIPQNFIDFIIQNKVLFFENKKYTIFELIKLLRKDNLFWFPIHLEYFDI